MTRTLIYVVLLAAFLGSAFAAFEPWLCVGFPHPAVWRLCEDVLEQEFCVFENCPNGTPEANQGSQKKRCQGGLPSKCGPEPTFVCTLPCSTWKYYAGGVQYANRDAAILAQCQAETNFSSCPASNPASWPYRVTLTAKCFRPDGTEDKTPNLPPEDNAFSSSCGPDPNLTFYCPSTPPKCSTWKYYDSGGLGPATRVDAVDSSCWGVNWTGCSTGTNLTPPTTSITRKCFDSADNLAPEFTCGNPTENDTNFPCATACPSWEWYVSPAETVKISATEVAALVDSQCAATSWSPCNYSQATTPNVSLPNHTTKCVFPEGKDAPYNACPLRPSSYFTCPKGCPTRKWLNGSTEVTQATVTAAIDEACKAPSTNWALCLAQSPQSPTPTIPYSSKCVHADGTVASGNAQLVCGAAPSTQCPTACPTYTCKDSNSATVPCSTWDVCDYSTCFATGVPSSRQRTCSAAGTGLEHTCVTSSCDKPCPTWQWFNPSGEQVLPQVAAAGIETVCNSASTDWSSCLNDIPTPPTPNHGYEPRCVLSGSSTNIPGGCGPNPPSRRCPEACPTPQCSRNNFVTTINCGDMCNYSNCPSDWQFDMNQWRCANSERTINSSGCAPKTDICRCSTRPTWKIVTLSTGMEVTDKAAMCNHTTCTSASAAVSFQAGLGVKCVSNFDGSILQDIQCEGLPVPTVVEKCGACPTQKCSYAAAPTAGSVLTEIIDCTATCDAQLTAISAATGFPATQALFADCFKATIKATAYCVDSDNKVVAQSLCSTLVQPAPCPSFCQKRCGWEGLDGESAAMCSETCTSTRPLELLQNCGGSAQQTRSCYKPSFASGVMTLIKDETIDMVCGNVNLGFRLNCRATCGAFKCAILGANNVPGTLLSDGACTRMPCSEFTTHYPTLVDDASATCNTARTGFSCYSKVGEVLTYDATGAACGLITGAAKMTVGVANTCHSKACYGVSCAFAEDVAATSSLTFSATACASTFDPICTCSCDTDTTCTPSDYAIATRCNLIIDGKTEVVDVTTDEDRYATVCPRIDVQFTEARECVVDDTHCTPMVTDISVPAQLYQFHSADLTFKYVGPDTGSISFFIELVTSDAALKWSAEVFTLDVRWLTADAALPTKSAHAWALPALALPPQIESTVANKYVMYAVVAAHSAVAAADAARSTTSFTIGSYCSYQTSLGAENMCSGHVGATCAVASNHCTCPGFSADYFPTTRDCTCPDLNPTDPSKCTFAKDCTTDTTTTSCVNGFQSVDDQGNCTGTCTCTGEFTGTTCNECGLTTECGANGTPNGSCTDCVCKAGFAGPQCTFSVTSTQPNPTFATPSQSLTILHHHPLNPPTIPPLVVFPLT